MIRPGKWVILFLKKAGGVCVV